MFEQELSALLDVVAYIEDEELQGYLEEAIRTTVVNLVAERAYKADEAANNEARLCRFNEAWRGRCLLPSVNDSGTLCETHLGIVCGVCGAHAVLTCAQNLGAFTCGQPVCKKHQDDNGRGVHR